MTAKTDDTTEDVLIVTRELGAMAVTTVLSLAESAGGPCQLNLAPQAVQQILDLAAEINALNLKEGDQNDSEDV